VGRSSVRLASGISLGFGQDIGRQYLTNNIAVFVFTSAKSLMLGVINGLGSHIGYSLE